MKKSRMPTILLLALLLTTMVKAATEALAQQKHKPLVCKSTAFASFKMLPQLKYRCNAELPITETRS